MTAAARFSGTSTEKQSIELRKRLLFFTRLLDGLDKKITLLIPFSKKLLLIWRPRTVVCETFNTRQKRMLKNQGCALLVMVQNLGVLLVTIIYHFFLLTISKVTLTVSGLEVCHYRITSF